MKRDSGFAAPEWDDPFWHAVRMVVDLTTHRKLTLTIAEVITRLRNQDGNDAAQGLADYLSRRPEMLGPLVDYLHLRVEAANHLLALMRTEEEAKSAFATLSKEVVATYGTRSGDHHQSSKVIVATVEILSKAAARQAGLAVNVNPQQRIAAVAGDHIWVSPRRLDGALPDLFNPVGIWEIKEYWGKTGGGSKMSDAIYECQLVGTELRAFERRYDQKIYHYMILDGKIQWHSRKSDVRRAVDLLYSGLIDELIVGSEIMTEWPRVAKYLCDVATQAATIPNPRIEHSVDEIPW